MAHNWLIIIEECGGCRTHPQRRALPKCVQCYSCFLQCKCSFPCPLCWHHEWPESHWASSGIWIVWSGRFRVIKKIRRLKKFSNSSNLTYSNDPASVWTQESRNFDNVCDLPALVCLQKLVFFLPLDKGRRVSSGLTVKYCSVPLIYCGILGLELKRYIN